MDEILQHLRNLGMIRFPRKYQQTMAGTHGFSKWCEMDFATITVMVSVYRRLSHGKLLDPVGVSLFEGHPLSVVLKDHSKEATGSVHDP